MGFFDRGRKKALIPKNATFRLTQGGEEELQKFLAGDEHAILVALQTNGTSTVEEIASASGLSKGQVERQLPKLVRKQQVQFIGGEGGGYSSIADEEA